MPDFGDLDKNYAGVGAGLSDALGKVPLSLGRHNKWGYLVLVGPDGVEHTIGLIDTLTITEANDSQFLDSAGSDWLELEIGTRRWTGSFSRKHIRGADMKLLMHRIYPLAKDIDFRYMPCVIKYKFNYKPPIGLTSSYESSVWTYHKIIIVRYTNNIITAPNKLLSESVEFIGAGEGYIGNNNADTYESNTLVWGGETYLLSVARAADPVATGASQLASSFGNQNVSEVRDAPR